MTTVSAHSHHHQHHHEFRNVEGNREYFDSFAEKYEDVPYAEELGAAVSEGMKSAFTFDPTSFVIMDFACGTGIITRNLAPFVQRIIGVDISPGMLEVYRKKAGEAGLALKTSTECIELKGAKGELNDLRFDAIVCSVAYHHFESISDVTSILAGFLKPGGALIVADFVKGGMSEKPLIEAPPGWQHCVSTMVGFDEAEIKVVFENAGLGDFNFNPSIRIEDGDRYAQLFVARGIKC